MTLEMQVLVEAIIIVYNPKSQKEVDIVLNFLNNKLTKAGMFGEITDLLATIKSMLGESPDDAKMASTLESICTLVEIFKRDLGDPLADASLITTEPPRQVSEEEAGKARQWAIGPLDNPPENKDENPPENKGENPPEESFFQKYKTPLMVGGSLLALGAVALVFLKMKKSES